MKIEAELYEQQGQWKLRIRAPQWVFKQIEHQLGSDPVLQSIVLILKDSSLLDSTGYNDPMAIEQNVFEITTKAKLQGTE